MISEVNMKGLRELPRLNVLLIEANVRRKTKEYSTQLGVAINKDFKLNKDSTSGHVYVKLIIFDAEEIKEPIEMDELEERSQAEIDLNYHINLLDDSLGENIDNYLVWWYVYPQLKADVSSLCNSMCLPNIILPNDLIWEKCDDRDR